MFSTRFAAIAAAAAIALAGAALSVAAQTPTPTPTLPATPGSPTATVTPGTPTSTATMTPTSPATTTPTSTPTPDATPPPGPTPPPIVDGGPFEPDFRFGEIVASRVVPIVPLDGPWGTQTNYITLEQDTAGVVRIRYSLYFVPEGFYLVYIHGHGSCTNPGPVIAQLYGIQQSADSAAALTLHFLNTTQLSLTAGSPNSILDRDGTSLVIAAEATEAQPLGVPVACAVLASAPGAPDTGTGATSAPTGDHDHLALRLGVGFGVTLLVAGGYAWSVSRRRR